MNKPLSYRATEFYQLLCNGQFSDSREQNIPSDQAEKSALNTLQASARDGANVYIVGNGGSSAVASHIMTDFRNIAHLRAVSLHESSVLTCFANDYGYEHSYMRQLEKFARPQDVLIAISSSGCSENILNSARFMNRLSASVITLTGFSDKNPLRQLGSVNYWVDSNDYGYVEIAHLFLLHHWADSLAARLHNEKSKRHKEKSTLVASNIHYMG